MFNIIIESKDVAVKLVVSKEVWNTSKDIILDQIQHTIDNAICGKQNPEPTNRLTRYNLFGEGCDL